MYKHIVNPKTGKKLSIDSPEGKHLLKEYLKYSETHTKAIVGGGKPWNCEICSFLNKEKRLDNLFSAFTILLSTIFSIILLLHS